MILHNFQFVPEITDSLPEAAPMQDVTASTSYGSVILQPFL